MRALFLIASILLSSLLLTSCQRPAEPPTEHPPAPQAAETP